MEVFIAIMFLGLFVLSWIVFGVLLASIFCIFYAIVFGIYETAMFWTVNNVTNLLASIPIIGWLLAFVFNLPWVILPAAFMSWLGLQTFFGPACICFQGDPKMHLINNPGFCADLPIAEFFINNFSWLYKYSGFQYSVIPWHDTIDMIETDHIYMMIFKLFILALPYTIIFVVPAIYIFWTVMKVFVAPFGIMPGKFYQKNQ